MTAQTWVALAAAAIALACLLAIVLLGYRGQRVRTDLELARSLHADLTSGDVAAARVVLSRHDTAENADLRAAYFTLLWCFERIHVGRSTIGRTTKAVRFLDESIAWHVREWLAAFPAIEERLGPRDTSRAAFDALVDELSLRGSR